jgi:hypothetical protein
MGFLSKIGKGIKSAFKKVGKGIKSAFKSIGKFMDKIGIVGQIGLSLLLPGIGSALSGMWGSLVGGMQAYSGIGSTIINGAGNFLNVATEVASNITKPFTTITEGVKNVVGETLKAGANALGLDKAAITLGKKFGSQYLQDLGASISNANLTSIGNAFDEGVEGFLKSFSGGGVDPTGAYETNRLEATTASPAEIASVTPPTPQFAEADLATPDMPAGMTEVKVTAKAPDSLLSPTTDVTPPAVGDPSAVVNRKLASQAYSAEIAKNADIVGNIIDSGMAGAPTESAVTSAIKTTKKGLIEETYDRAVAAGTKMLREAPGKAMDKFGNTLTDVPSQLLKKEVGLQPDTIVNQRSIGISIPTIQEAPMVGASVGMDPVQYVANNQQSMGLQPFGFNANMYNAATYINTMRKYGLA